MQFKSSKSEVKMRVRQERRGSKYNLVVVVTELVMASQNTQLIAQPWRKTLVGHAKLDEKLLNTLERRKEKKCIYVLLLPFICHWPYISPQGMKVPEFQVQAHI